MGDCLQDCRFAARLFARAPVFAAVIITTLALGIGANTAVFSVVDTVLLRPLPYRDPERLVAVWNRDTREPGPSKLFEGYRDFEAYARHVESFEHVSVATWAIAPQLWRGHGAAREIFAMPVGTSFFSMLGVSASLGRTFAEDDERAGCSVVLSHRFWQTELGGDADAIGRTLDLGRRACVIRGVMPPDFIFYPTAAQLWILLDHAFAPGRDELNVGVFARLRPGATLARAQAELSAVHAALHRADDQRHFSPVAGPLHEEFTWLASRTLRTTLIALSVAVALVLLITCLNVATLLVGRSSGRVRELAVRTAIGAGRARLVRQMLGEALVLSIVGTGLGVLAAYAAIRYFRYAGPIELPPGADVGVHWRTLIFTGVISVATTLAFGLVPAWRGSLTNPGDALKTGGRGYVHGGSPNRLMQALVVVQLAVCVVLLGAAALLVGSVMRMSAEPLGFDPDRLFTTRITLPAERYADDTRVEQFCSDLLGRAAVLPGLSGVAMTFDTMFGGEPDQAIEIAGQALAPERRAPEYGVTPAYFHVYRIPVRQGRAFTSADRAGSEPVAVVNEALSRRYFGGTPPIGARVRLGEPGKQGPWLTIVGVVGDVKDTSLYREMSWSDAGPTVFRPLAQRPRRSLSLAFRLSDGAQRADKSVQDQIARIDDELPINDVVEADRWIAGQLAYPRFRSVMFGGFAALALGLAAVGLFGLLWQYVAERNRELALRMAVGASPGAILWLVVRHGGAPVVAGLVAGLVVSRAAGWILAEFLYDLRPSDPRVMAVVSLAIAAVALVAIGVPARRAVCVDATAVLREE